MIHNEVLYNMSVIALLILAIILIWIFRSPFKYPYKIIYIDISGKRSPRMEDLIDSWLINNGLSLLQSHCIEVEQWKHESQTKIRLSLPFLRKHRTKQYLACLDDAGMFQFIATRSQTRYQQRNYIRSAYKVDVGVAEFHTNYFFLKQRYDQLKDIGFECTLSQYQAKNQRKMMTKELRERIAKRDNYTCQICGKYMPDGVGLHIDHIIPIAKGGKSIPSNLQVLCSKCNGRKSSN